jgi:hypothetical protein
MSDLLSRAAAVLQLGLNVLADLTHEEYKQKYALGFRKFVRKSNQLTSFSHDSLDADNLPPAVDWRKKAVAEVKNQQQVMSKTPRQQLQHRAAAGGRGASRQAAAQPSVLPKHPGTSSSCCPVLRRAPAADLS